MVFEKIYCESGLTLKTSDDGQKKYKCTVCGNLVMKNFLKKHFSILHRMSPEEIEAAVATLSPIQAVTWKLV